MNEKDTEERFMGRIREALDRRTEDLDAATLSRLRQARKEALAGARAESVRSGRWFGVPAAGLATAAVVLLVTLIHVNRPVVSPPAQHLEVLEILASGDDLDLFANLEFYAWVSEEDREK